MRVRRNSASAVVLLGLPGSGKGTQARRLSEVLGLPALSTGDMLRHEVSAGTKLGKAVRDLMDQGLLVGDDLMNKAVCARLKREDCANGFVLDGYPRTVAQAKFLDNCLARLGFAPASVLWLDVATAEVETRLLHRLQCPSCGRTYGFGATSIVACEIDGVALVHRVDDNAAVVRERLTQYRLNTAPLLDYYQGLRLAHVPASGNPDRVADLLLAAIQGPMFPRAHRSIRFAHAAL